MGDVKRGKGRVAGRRHEKEERLELRLRAEEKEGKKRALEAAESRSPESRKLEGETEPACAFLEHDYFSPSSSPANERAGLFVLGISAPKETGRSTAFQKAVAK